MPKLRRSFLFGVAALLVPDHNDGTIFELGKARDHGGVVGKAAVAMQLQKIGKEHLNVIEGIGPLRMAGQKDALPGVLRGTGNFLP